MFKLISLQIFKPQLKLLSNIRQFSELVQKESLLRRLTDSDSGIAEIELNRPKQRNAFNKSLVNQLNETLDDIAQDPQTRVLIIRSLIPGVFCAGADLIERASFTQEQVAQFVTNLRSLLQKIHDLPIPVIAAIDGLALGGGLELALACDLRIASANAKIGLVETKLAIIPGAGGTQRLPRLINPAIAKELIYTAKILDGQEAEHLGLVNHSVQQNKNGDSAYFKSLEIAREIIPNGPIAIKLAKKAINYGLNVDLKTGLAIEETCYNQLIPTKDRIEGLVAFKEKRRPNYKGE